MRRAGQRTYQFFVPDQGQKFSSGPGSGLGRRPSSTPPRMRANPGAPYPSVPIPNGSGGDVRD
eukprot:7985512-Lingulodinium_polyedra.AAC.1